MATETSTLRFVIQKEDKGNILKSLKDIKAASSDVTKAMKRLQDTFASMNASSAKVEQSARQTSSAIELQGVVLRKQKAVVVETVQNLATYKRQLQNIHQAVKASAEGVARYASSITQQDVVTKKAGETANWYTSQIEITKNAMKTNIQVRAELQAQIKANALATANASSKKEKALLIEKAATLQTEALTKAKLYEDMSTKKKLLTEEMALVVEKKHIALVRLAEGQARSKANIDKMATLDLRKYTLQIQESKKAIRLQKDLISRNVEIQIQSNKIINRASIATDSYNQQIKETNIALGRASTKVEKLALNYKILALERNKDAVGTLKATAIADVGGLGIVATKVDYGKDIQNLKVYSNDLQKLNKIEATRANIIKQSIGINEQYKKELARLDAVLKLKHSDTERQILVDKRAKIAREQLVVATKRLSAEEQLNALTKKTVSAMIATDNAAYKNYTKNLKKARDAIKQESSAVKQGIMGWKLSKDSIVQTKQITQEYEKTLRQLKIAIDGATLASEKEALTLRQTTIAANLKNVAAMQKTLTTRKLLTAAWATARTKLKLYSTTARRVGQTLTRYLTTAMVGALTVGVKMAANIESQTVRFGILTSSMKKGSKLFKELIEYSARTPFQLNEITKATQTLLAFGSPLNEVTDELRRLGDVAMGDSEKLERVVTSFGKVRSRGTAHMRELNRFIISGVPIIEQLNKNIGVTGDQLFKMIETNKVSFTHIKDAITDLTNEGGRFYEMTETVSRTLQGRFSTALDNLKLDLSSLAQPFVKDMTRMLEKFIDWSQGFRALSESTRKEIALLMAALAGVGPALTVLSGLGVLVSLLGSIPAVLTALTIAVAGFLVTVELKKRIQEADALSKKVKTYKNALKDMTEYTTDATKKIPGLTKEIYDIAKAYGAETQAINILIRHQALLAKQRAGFEASEEYEEAQKAYKKLKHTIFTERFSLSSMVNKTFIKVRELAGASAKQIAQDIQANIENEIKKAPDLAPFFTKIQKALSTEDITYGDLLKLPFKETQEAIQKFGDSLTEENYLAEAAKKWLADIMHALNENEPLKALKEALDIDPNSLYKNLLNLLHQTSFIGQEINADLDSGMTSTTTGIMKLKNKILEIQDAYSAWGATTIGNGIDFTALVNEKNVIRTKALVNKTITGLTTNMAALVKIRISEIKEEAGMSNAILSLLGLDDEKTTVSMLKEELNAIIAEIQGFGYNLDAIKKMKTGEMIVPEVLTELIASGKQIGEELRKALEHDARVNLFEIYFSGDLDATKKAELEAKLKKNYEELATAAGAADISVDDVFTFLDAGTLNEYFSKTEIDLVNNTRILYDELQVITDKAVKEAEDNTSLIEAFVGGADSYADFKKQLHLTELYKELNDTLNKFSEITGQRASDILEKINNQSFIDIFSEGVKNQTQTLNSILNHSFTLSNKNLITTFALYIKTLLDEIFAQSEEEVKAITIDHTALYKAFFGGAEDWKAYADNLKLGRLLTDLQDQVIANFPNISTDALFDKMQEAKLSPENFLSSDFFTKLPTETQDLVKKIMPYFQKAVEEETAKGDVSILTSFVGDPEKFMEDYTRKIKLQSIADKVLALAKEIDPEWTIIDLITNQGDPITPDQAQALQKYLDEIGLTIEQITPKKTIAEALFGMKKGDDITLFVDDLANVVKNNLVPAFESLGAALAEGATFGEGFAESFKSIGLAIVNAMPELLLEAGLKLLLDETSANDVTGLALIASSGLTAIGSGYINAKKAPAETASSSSSLSYSAKGDIFQNGYIANDAILRSTAYGASMIGEAGDEAVLPLTRIGGKLGVASTGGGSTVNVNIINNSDAQIEQTETTNADGSKNIDVIVFNLVKKGMLTGEFDKSLRGNYGISRQGRR